MPYKIKKSGKGYKVYSPSGPKSKKPLSKERALAQQRAIYTNTKGESAEWLVNQAESTADAVILELGDKAYDALLSRLADGQPLYQIVEDIGIKEAADKFAMVTSPYWDAIQLGRKLIIQYHQIK